SAGRGRSTSKRGGGRSPLPVSQTRGRNLGGGASLMPLPVRELAVGSNPVPRGRQPLSRLRSAFAPGAGAGQATRSKRSAFITLVQAATKSATNFSFASSAA